MITAIYRWFFPVSRKEALRRARAIIECERHNLICDALSWVGSEQPSLRAAGIELRREIARDLEGAYSLGEFIRVKHNYRPSRKQMRMCRLAWIDKMLEAE